LAFAVAPAQGAFPGQAGKIAFNTNRDGNFEIYSMTAAGGTIPS
jgi:Tol biopolymer transport system component